MRKTYRLLGLILLLAVVLRLFRLGEVPPGLTNDEVNIIINAQSFLKTGQNIPGVVTGIFGSPKGDLSGGIHSEISSYLLVPFMAVTGFSWPAVKIAFVFASLGIVFVSYLLLKELVSETAGIWAAFLSAISPWTIFFGRSAYESILSCLFYLLAIYLILVKKGWRIFWALPFLIAGLFSYFSAKTLILPITLSALVSYRALRPKESLKPIVALNCAIILFLLLYGAVLIKTPAGLRFGELKGKATLADTVIAKRTASIDLPAASVFENKYTEDFRTRITASLGGISPNFLFLNGQPESIPSLSIPDHGPLYLIDLPLIILGMIFLAQKSRPVLSFFLLLAGITLIPNFLNLAGTTYMIRTVILFPVLAMLSAIGLYSIKSKTVRVIFVFAYLFFFGNFIYQYFGRLPIEKNEGWFLADREISYFAKLAPINNNRIVVVTSTPKHSFYRYLLYGGKYADPREIREINKSIENKNYSTENISFVSTCPKSYDSLTTTYFVDAKLNCPAVKGSTIASIRDGGTEYIIVNDRLCAPFVKNHYPLIKNYGELDIGSLPREKFCRDFVTDLND